MRNKPKGIVLLSGGLDSSVLLYLAKSRGFKCLCLSFDYGQRHKRELKAAGGIAQSAKVDLRIVKINFPWKGSALLDKNIKIPMAARKRGQKKRNNIPLTYVPARNIIFLSLALSYAEAVGAEALFIGAHALDYSGYPDCRPEFYRAFKKVIASGTKSGAEKRGIKVLTPLINMRKSAIITLGVKLGVPFEFTWSCYQGKASPCNACDSCYYRRKGFQEAGLSDPLLNK